MTKDRLPANVARRTRRFAYALASLMLLSVAFAVPAAAQTYPNVQGTGAAAGAGAAAGGGALARTGIEIGSFLVLGAALILIGFALRRTARRGSAVDW